MLPLRALAAKLRDLRLKQSSCLQNQRASAELPTALLHAFEQSCSSNFLSQQSFAASELLAIRLPWLFYIAARVNSIVAPTHPITQKTGLAPAGEIRMLWTIFAILLLLWLLGWGFHVAGSLIHLILVIAIVVLLIQVITGRRAAV